MRVFRAVCIVSMSVLFVLAATLFTFAQEKKVTKKNVPPAVLAAFAKAYPDAKVKGYARETEKGKTYYEIESMNGKMSLDALYQADGTVAEVEEGVAPSDLPAQVQDAVKAKYADGKITKAEKTTRGEDTSYELRVASGKKTVSLAVDPTGKILKGSKGGAKKEEKEEKEEKED